MMSFISGFNTSGRVMAKGLKGLNYLNDAEIRHFTYQYPWFFGQLLLAAINLSTILIAFVHLSPALCPG